MSLNRSLLVLAGTCLLVACGRRPSGAYTGRATLETNRFEGSKLADKTAETFQDLRLKLDRVGGSHLTYALTFENGPLAGCVIKASNRVPHELRVQGSIVANQKCDIRYKRGVLKNVSMQGTVAIDLTDGGLGRLIFIPSFIAATEPKGYRMITLSFQSDSP